MSQETQSSRAKVQGEGIVIPAKKEDKEKPQ
jgi:hypothetical protein